MAATIDLGGIPVEVIKEDIKNVHLSVYPPTGKVRISAPLRMNLDTIRIFTISKLGWIRQQQRKIREQERETPREYLDRESHYVWGKRYLLKVVEKDAAPSRFQSELEKASETFEFLPGGVLTVLPLLPECTERIACRHRRRCRQKVCK
jgi:predicted metal-dependent hydrolase